MPNLRMVDLWLSATRVFPALQQAVEELCPTATVASPPAFTQRLLKALRRRGIKAESPIAEDCALLLEDTLWVQVVAPDADLTVQVAQLRATLRQRAVARAGYLIQPGPRPGWRWVQIAGQQAPSAGVVESQASTPEARH
jgi:hypothetical protein